MSRDTFCFVWGPQFVRHVDDALPSTVVTFHDHAVIELWIFEPFQNRLCAPAPGAWNDRVSHAVR